MCIELNRTTYLSLLARAAMTYRERAYRLTVNPDGESAQHDAAVNVRRARQLETVLHKARFTGETFNLVDDHVESLFKGAGIVNL